ncbi:MAG TPA: IS5 family transposase [Terriglobales bacterium]|nr:IS5 family transposase [Terriglobales bacterium]
MRGDDNLQEGMYSYISPEKRVPADHPLRPIRKIVDEILKEMSPKFQKLYSDVGRPSIAPERLLRSLLLQIFYSVRSERMLIEQLQYNLLFRWFVGMEMDETVWNHAVYSKNRERLLNEEIAESFFQRVLERAKPYMSDEHFTVDGTLIEAWASHKSFRPKDGTGKPPGAGGDVDFRGEKRKNETHESTTDPDARLFTKSRGSEAKLSYMGHVLMENRNGLLVQTFLTEASGRAERDAAMLMAEAIPAGKRVTLGGDKNYDTREFVRELRGMNITPHVAQNTTNRRSAVDERTTRHTGYEVSQRKRKRVEQSFGWMKMIGMLKKVKLRGIDKVGWLFTFTGAAYNLCRLRNLMATT